MKNFFKNDVTTIDIYMKLELNGSCICYNECHNSNSYHGYLFCSILQNSKWLSYDVDIIAFQILLTLDELNGPSIGHPTKLHCFVNS